MPARKSTGREVIGVFLGSFGFEVFMLLSLTPNWFVSSHCCSQSWDNMDVKSFQRFLRRKKYHFGSLTDDILPIFRVMNYPDH